MFKCHNMSGRAFVSQYMGRDPVGLLLVLHAKNYKRSNRIVKFLRVTIYEFWIGNRIYWTLTERTYKYGLCSHCSTHFTNHCNHSTHKVFLVCCLNQSLPGDGSQQCPLLPCSRSYWLETVSQITHSSNCPAYNISARITQKTPFLYYSFEVLPRKFACLRSRYSVTTVVELLLSRLLPSNRSTYHDTIAISSAFTFALSANEDSERNSFEAYIPVSYPQSSRGQFDYVIYE
jgi:hypothetical protein